MKLFYIIGKTEHNMCINNILIQPFNHLEQIEPTKIKGYMPGAGEMAQR